MSSHRNLKVVTFFHRANGWRWRVLGWLDEMVLDGSGCSSRSAAIKAGRDAARAYAQSEDYRKATGPKPVQADGQRIERRNRSWRKIK